MWKIVFTVLSAVFATGAAAVMVGGLTTIDINDEGAQNALNYAVNQHNMKSNDAYLRKVTGVNKVQVQVSRVHLDLSFSVICWSVMSLNGVFTCRPR